MAGTIIAYHLIFLTLMTSLPMTFTLHENDFSSYICPANLSYCECPPQLSNVLIFPCMPSEKDMEYTVKYEPEQHQVTLECISDISSSIRLVEDMFKIFRFPPSVDAVNIYSCPAPNITFISLLGSLNNVKTLKLKLEKQPLNASLFQNLTNVEVFNLEGSVVETVEATLLEDMKSLKNLTLSLLPVETLPSGLFNHNLKILSINLDENKLKSLQTGIFSELEELEKLTMNYNQLSHIANEVFQRLIKLRILSMKNNLLTILPSDLLKEMPLLEKLDLSYNNLNDLPPGLFETNRFLKILHLQRNSNFSYLPDNIFENTTFLQKLYLDHNNFSALPLNILSPLKSLSELFLNNNQLQEIPAGLFKNNLNLTVIELSVNKLKSLPMKLFASLTHLQYLHLRNNYLTTITKFTFLSLTSLKLLDLSNNQVTYIDDLAFEEAENITFLDLSENKLLFKESSFHLPIKVEYLNLSNNFITEIPMDWLTAQYLKVINFSRNNIEAVNANQLLFTSKSVVIDLQMNNISTVNLLDLEKASASPSATFPTLPYPAYHQQPKVLINQNPMRCECSLLPFIRYLKRRNLENDAPLQFEANLLHCSSPPDDFNYDYPLTSVSEDTISCSIFDMCDKRCLCRLKAASNSVTVNCTNQNLATMTTLRMPWNVTEVHLENSSLASISVLESPNWVNVSFVYLSRNKIQSIDQPIALPLKLKLLTLDGNYLEVLPKWLIQEAQRRTDFTLMLGNNPWRCDCNSFDLIKLLNSSNQIVGDTNSVRCGPGPLQNKRLINLDASMVCLHKRADPSAPTLVMVFSIIILLLVISVVAFMVVRNRDRIKLWFFRRRMCLWLRTPEDIEAGHPL